MHLSFENLDELEAFMTFAGYTKTDLYKEGIIAAQGYDNRDLPVDTVTPEDKPEEESNSSRLVVSKDSFAPAPAKRTRRTKAEIEADRARAEAAMAAPLEAEAPEASDPAAAALAALTGAADDKPPYVDMATYAAQHSARLAETVTPKDFLTTCQAFIAKHQLPAYMELLTTVGIAPTAVASCTAEQRGNILARMEWHDTEFAPVK